MSEHDPIAIEHSEEQGQGAFVVMRDGRRLAEMTYVRTGDVEITIDHTEVSEELRGVGVARKLLDTAVAWARATGTKVRATCPYAKSQFERDPSLRDVLA